MPEVTGSDSSGTGNRNQVKIYYLCVNILVTGWPLNRFSRTTTLFEVMALVAVAAGQFVAPRRHSVGGRERGHLPH